MSDLQKPERMLRLLQGDVGSGKTVVALFACAAAIEAGGHIGDPGGAQLGAQAALIGLRAAVPPPRRRVNIHI